jgi:hypothetical protein
MEEACDGIQQKCYKVILTIGVACECDFDGVVVKKERGGATDIGADPLWVKTNKKQNN